MLAGMQMMFKNLVEQAAPELVKQVDDFKQILLSFKAQSDRIEANQKLIMQHLGIGENHGDGTGLGRHVAEIERPIDGAGKSADE
jgi:hypothetical protein